MRAAWTHRVPTPIGPGNRAVPEGTKFSPRGIRCNGPITQSSRAGDPQCDLAEGLLRAISWDRPLVEVPPEAGDIANDNLGHSG